MSMVIPLALGLIIGGLLICLHCDRVRIAVLSTVLNWTGVVVTVLCLLLLTVPALVWLHKQAVAILGL